MEKWKGIEDWEGIYQISNHGRLKSFKKCPEGKILSTKNKTGWYLSVVLCAKDKENESHKIHSLVAKHFIPNPLDKPAINHKDGNKQNNFEDNIEWVTYKENSDHAMKNGLANVLGMNHYNQIIKPRPVTQISLNKNAIQTFPNCVEAGKATGVCARNIHQVAAQTEYKPYMTRKQAGGYIWRF